MIKMNISVIQKLLTPLREFIRDDMGVDVDFKHSLERGTRRGGSQIFADLN